MASEFFNSDFGKMLDLFYEDTELIRQLFKIFECDGGINILLTGYFAKAVNALMRHNPSGFLTFMYQEGFHLEFINHLYSSSISDLVYNFIANSFCEFLPYVTQMLEGLIEKIGCDYNSMVSINSQNLVSSVLKNRDFVKCHSEIADEILKPDNINKILKYFSSELECTVVGAAKVTKQLLELDANKASLTQSLEPYLEVFSNLLSSEAPMQSSQYGMTQPRVGQVKLLLCEIAAHLVEVPSLVSSGILTQLTDMFSVYNYHTLFQNAYLTLVEAVMGSQDKELQEALLEQAGLKEALKSLVVSPYEQIQGHTVRRGVMGHVYNIGEMLIKEGIELGEDFGLELSERRRLENWHLGGETSFNFESEEEAELEEEEALPEEVNYMANNYWRIEVNLDELEDLE